MIDLSQHPTRIADGDNVWRDILGDDAPRTDYRTVANRHAWEDHDIRAKPTIVADSYGARILKTLVAPLCVERMPSCGRTSFQPRSSR